MTLPLQETLLYHGSFTSRLKKADADFAAVFSLTTLRAFEILAVVASADVVGKIFSAHGMVVFRMDL